MNLLPPRPPITDNADDRPMRQVSYMLPSGYSLTWPIWHRMSHAEKLKIARSENLTIGAFEEEVALFMAIEEDTAAADRAENSPALDTNISEAVSMTTTEEPSSLLEKHRLKLEGLSIFFENDDENDDANQESVPVDSVQVKRAEPQAPDPLPSSPDLLTSLPVDVIIYSLLPFLPTTNIVKHLPCAHRFFSALLSPPLYKMLCRRRFNTPNLPKKFNTYKQMYHSRPHPLHYGVYTMRCSYVKKITRDMWTSSSLPPGVILKGEWFRHIVFLEGNRCGYLQTSKCFAEVEREFINWRNGKLSIVNDARYEVKRGLIAIEVAQSWADIFFHLRYFDRRCLTFERHFAVMVNSTTAADVVEYEIPKAHAGESETGVFYFKRNWRF